MSGKFTLSAGETLATGEGGLSRTLLLLKVRPESAFFLAFLLTFSTLFALIHSWWSMRLKVDFELPQCQGEMGRQGRRGLLSPNI